MNDPTDRIRMRAYDIWREAGEPMDLADEHWTQAEREIEGKEPGSAPADDAPPPKTAAINDGDA